MTSTEPTPTPDELSAMAYADGELRGAELELFKQRLASEPALNQRVAYYRALEVLARTMAPPEPADLEWDRIEQESLYSTSMGLGLGLVLVGGLGLSAMSIATLLRSPMDVLSKVLLTALSAGLALLFVNVLSSRVRTQSLDPYRLVKR